MKAKLSSKTIRVLGALSLIVVALTTVVSTRASSRPQTRAAEPSAAGPDYVGSEVCLACHEDQGKHFQNTPMGKAFAHPRTDKERLGCEACHGPGRTHLEAGGG